ncbi:MAG: chromosome segregation protein SMC [Mycobacteriales bacterium]
MHLASLTLRGFKSFASATTLRFEPGITAVVGPNGSGKSNVIDAIAWVLGEQGARSLRGGKMEDVIFAGTAGRPPLGRAEVVLTIDNSDGALPIEYAEVTVGRLMYRSGESEYAINGRPCRLLDVQELLSDSGIGRELHVVVGQGQLDTVLHARPEDRRAFIEEAAGVLKHRRRKDKALRKLDAMTANLTRLADLTTELRRQLRPLGQQAEVARRAAGVQAELRDARLRLLADDLLTLRRELAAEEHDEAAARERLAAVEAALAGSRAREAELEGELAGSTERMAGVADTYYQLCALAERFAGLVGLAAERARNLGAEQQAILPEPDPMQLEREAAGVRRQEGELTAALALERVALSEAATRRAAAESVLVTEEAAAAASARAGADRREQLAGLVGEIGALRSRAARTDAETARLAGALEDAQARAAAARASFLALESEIAGLDDGETGLDSRHELAEAELAEAERELAAADEEERVVERERSALAARHDALAAALERRDGVEAVVSAGPQLSGVLGPLLPLLAVAPGAEAAVAAALGATADAVAVRSLSDAVEVLDLLKATGGGRVGLLVGDGPPPPPSWPELSDGFVYAIDLVDAPDALRPALRRALDRVAVVPTLPEAARLVESVPELRAVTADGDLLGAGWAVGGSAGAPTRLELQAAVEEAARARAEVAHRGDRLRFTKAAAAERRAEAASRVQESLDELHQSDARLAAVADQLGHLGERARAAAGEVARLAAACAEAQDGRDREAERLTALEERLAALGATPVDEPDGSSRQRVADACAAARAAEVEVRLAVRTTEERVRALAGRAEGLERRAASLRTAAQRAAVVRARRERLAVTARAVGYAARTALAQVEGARAAAAAERNEAEAVRAAADRARAAERGRGATLAADLSALTGVAHRDEVARAEQRLRIAALEDRGAAEYGVAPGELLAEYGPQTPVPPPAGSPVNAEPTAYDRTTTEKRVRTAERALAQLGRVNPLALEEYTALEERHGFLAGQLEDLKATRRDLLTVVREVDERVEQVFAAAYADVAREFETVFATLFPGGSGRLVLTDPDDLLTSGVEIEARPPGKRLKRLSLLSGGERSLTAIALLVAIFRARPSPFYVLDEVEAALDDRNLSRLLELLVALRETSQLIIVTHQKRTMEIADALYGVSMRDDGITAVISARLRREPELALA